MQPTSRLKIFYLAHLSKPKSDRLIYRAMLRRKPRRIAELGLGQGQRALRLIDVAARYAPREEVQYIGIDPFEDRSADAGLGLTLIQAHRLLKTSGARIKLIPGNPGEALIRSANHLGVVDLLIISSEGGQSEYAPQFWFYLLRLLHANTVVFREMAIGDGELGIEEISHEAVRSLAAVSQRRAA